MDLECIVRVDPLVSALAICFYYSGDLHCNTLTSMLVFSIIVPLVSFSHRQSYRFQSTWFSTTSARRYCFTVSFGID